MFHYRISGLSVASETELPGAIPAAPALEPDVTVQLAPLPMELAGASTTGPNWQMDGAAFLLHVPRVGRFLMSAGRSISVALEDGATPRDASAFVLGSALGILLHQRGALVLHGSAVAREGRAIAICGHSGAGKSTLAAALCQAGSSFVTDDICVVGLNSARQPVVLPDGRQLKLWRQSIERLDLDGRQGEAVREDLEKYFIAPEDVAVEAPRLSAIYALRESRPPLRDGIEELDLPDAMRMLEYEAYRPGLRRKLGSAPRMLAQAGAMFGHTRVFRLARPLGFARMGETVDALLRHWDAL
ncbi:MAG: hypothetical protein WDM86_17035 [Rhizomicrobium sp.]